jgi:uncharacterized protein (TIGR02231 family)
MSMILLFPNTCKFWPYSEDDTMPPRLTFKMLVLPILITAIPSTVQAKTIVAESKIYAATVYESRATVKRRAIVEVPEGEHKVVFENLPADIMTDSLRVEGKGQAQVTFGALKHKRIPAGKITIPNEKELVDKIRNLEDKKRRLRAEKEALKVRRTFLETLGEQAKLRENESIAKLELNPEQWRNSARMLADGIEKTHKASIKRDIKLREIKNEIDKLQRTLEQMRTNQRSTYSVTVPLDAEDATSFQIDLHYQVPDASWQPLYNARLDTTSGDLKLIQYGSVVQTTGEDWTDITLKLSTARPKRGAELPDLNPMWIDLEGKKRDSYSSLTEASFSSAAEDQVARAPEKQAAQKRREAGHRHAKIETGGFVSEYTIPGPSTVKADGSSSKLMVGPFKTESSMHVEVKPQKSEKAYLVSNVTVKGKSPLLPGRVNLFRDGAYIGKTNVSLLRPGKETTLGFGIDDKVSVERQVLKDKKSESGIISTGKVLEKHYVTTITNLHERDIDVVVSETTPVAKNEKVTAEIVKKVTTEGYTKGAEDKKGLLRWSYTLAPDTEKRVKIGWRIGWPEGEDITGLE